MIPSKNNKVQPGGFVPEGAYHQQVDMAVRYSNGGGVVQEEEDLHDYYLRITPWTVQVMLSIKMAIKSVWRQQVESRGPQVAKDSLKSFWTTIGVVSALLLSVSYGTAVTPVDTADSAKAMAVSVVAVLGGLSLMLSLVVIVVTVIYMIEIDNCTTDYDLAIFINKNGPLFDILTGVFSASVVLLVAQALGTMYITFGQTEFLIVICSTGTFACLGAAFAAVIAGRNRFVLWARYESPLAKERIARDKAKAQAAAWQGRTASAHQLAA